jgi:hypothetical protein
MLLFAACLGQCRFDAPMSISTAAPFYIKGRRRCANTRASKKKLSSAYSTPVRY